MDARDKGLPERPAALPANPAYKTLEVLLHNYHQNFAEPLEALLSDSKSLSAPQRLLLSNLNESAERMAMMLKSTLRQRGVGEAGGSAQAADGMVERIQVERVLRTLAKTTTSDESAEFFDYCVRSLTEVYDCTFAFIGLLMPDGESVRTVSVWAGDRLAENFEYELAGTPCADIINYKKELIPTNASSLYADDELLVQMGVDSYFGAPILSREKGVIGLVSVMDTRPMELNEWVAPVLGVFASRIALELQRKSAMEALRQSHATLEQRVKERTRELEIANEELQAFSYTLSHDLRAPVRAVNSFLDIVFADFGDELAAECLDHLNRVKRAGEKLDGLIEDILMLSQLSAREMLLKRIDISALASNILDNLAERNPERHVTLHVQPGMTGWGDSGLVEVVLQNLLSNAWKYTAGSEDPCISVDSSVRDGMTVFRVKDNGVGFDMAYVEKIFQPFQRLHTDAVFVGNGIGLATAQRVVHRHGGEIWADSEEGRGAVFSFTLGSQLPGKQKGG